MSGKNSALYYRNRRARERAAREAQGNPMRVYADYDQTPRIVALGEELRRLMAEPLPWPKSLYSDDPAAIEELVALDQKVGARKINSQDICACGKCGKEHHHNVSQTVRSRYGAGWSVIYFHSESCKALWNKARVEP